MTIRDRRKPWQKLRWWVVAWFLVIWVMVLLGIEPPDTCRDINHMSGGCW